MTLDRRANGGILPDGLSRAERREAIRQLERDNAGYSIALMQVPEERWRPAMNDRSSRVAVWRSRSFLVQVFDEDGATRLSINRTSVDEVTGRWKDGITWEELQSIKNEIGFAENDAIEIYPRAADEVNVANLRHLWILPEPLPFAWRKPVDGPRP